MIAHVYTRSQYVPVTLLSEDTEKGRGHLNVFLKKAINLWTTKPRYWICELLAFFNVEGVLPKSVGACWIME